MVTPMDSPGKLCGCAQSLKLCVNDDVVPSVYVTVSACDDWFPLTPVASIFNEENLPAGRLIVCPFALPTSVPSAGPRLNEIPLKVPVHPRDLPQNYAPLH